MFIGALASERTTEEELRQIFSVYGRVLEVVIRDKFGFVQFDSKEAAEAAIKSENRRRIGNLAIGEQFSCILFSELVLTFEAL